MGELAVATQVNERIGELRQLSGQSFSEATTPFALLSHDEHLMSSYAYGSCPKQSGFGNSRQSWRVLALIVRWLT